MPQQTLAHGNTLDQSWLSQLGYQNVSMVPPPTSTLMALCGRTGKGKSHLFQSCRNAYIYNFDLSPTSYPNPKAVIWPGIRSDGTPVEPDPANPSSDPEDGVPVSLTWEKALEKRQILKRMAEENVPNRPRIAVMDTTDRAYDYLQQWMVDEYNRLYGSNLENPKTEFSQLYGPSAWPSSYRYMLNFGLGLQKSGIGFCWVFHLGDKTVHIDEKTKEVFHEIPLVTSNLWHTISANVSLVGCIEARKEMVHTKVPMLRSDGSPLMGTGNKPRFKPVTESKTIRILTTDTTRLSEICKRRVDLPDEIVLSSKSPWDDFEQAYLTAASKTDDEETSN